MDVSGHGVGPALLSVSLLNVIRSNVISLSEFYRPDRFLGMLNDMFDSDQLNDMFFTMWYGVYDKCEKVLSYSSAGNPPALLMSGSSIKPDSVVMLKTDNKIIAGLPGVSYSMANIEIISPAVLYIFSDGVYEHHLDRGAMWRFGDFVNFMGQPNPQQKSRVDLLYDHVSKVNQEKAFDDDFTIIETRFL